MGIINFFADSRRKTRLTAYLKTRIMKKADPIIYGKRKQTLNGRKKSLCAALLAVLLLLVFALPPAGRAAEPPGTDAPSSEEPSGEEPSGEEPSSEEPSSEEPSSEEPSSEEPSSEEPSSGEPSSEEPSSEEPSSEEPSSEEPSSEEPSSEEPSSEEPSSEEPSSEEPSSEEPSSEEPPEPELPPKYGDADRNGKITAADARLTLRAAVGLDPVGPGTDMVLALDVNYDGSVTAADARQVLRVAVGLDQADESEVHVHVWGERTLASAATCTAAGVYKRVCALDNAHALYDYTARAPHTLKRVNEKRGGAKFYYLCAVCGADFYDDAGELPIPEFPIVEPKPVSDALWQACDNIMKKYGAVGAEAAVINDGFVTGYYYYGTAERSTGRQVDENTKYRVASISKFVTCLVFMALEDRGLVDENADISTYFGVRCRNPRWPDAVITPSMLMSHTSSFISTTEKTQLTGGEFSSYDFYYWEKPGAEYIYSDIGISLLSDICELAAGRPFNELAKELIFEPLGIDASFLASQLKDASNLGALYGEYGGYPISEMLAERQKLPLGTGLNLAQGNLTISAKDYAAIVAMILNRGVAMDGTRVLSEQAIDAIQTYRFDNIIYGVAYGSQIETTVIDGKIVFVHTGSYGGMFSTYMYCVEDNAGVVVLTSGCERYREPASEVYYVCLETIRTLYGKE